MEYKVLKDNKSELDVELDNLTLAEILRVYLNKDDNVQLAAWKREHPSKPPVLHIETKSKTSKKALQDAISKIEKDTKKILSDFKKLR